MKKRMCVQSAWKIADIEIQLLSLAAMSIAVSASTINFKEWSMMVTIWADAHTANKPSLVMLIDSSSKGMI